MQWPVMPWVLADYSSPRLNMDDPATFRDLSRPIGALNAQRLAMYKQRYADMPREEVGRMGLPDKCSRLPRSLRAVCKLQPQCVSVCQTPESSAQGAEYRPQCHMQCSIKCSHCMRLSMLGWHSLQDTLSPFPAV